MGPSPTSTVVHLCALVGQVEAEEENERLQAPVRYLTHYLEQIKRRAVDIAGLYFQMVLMLVKSEAMISELVLLTTINQWMDANPDVTMVKAQKIFAHVCYGTLPFNS